MRHFLFLIPRTPEKYRTALRELLWKACVKSILAQDYKHWTALVVGNKEEFDDPRIVFLEHDLLSKEEKLFLAVDWVSKLDKRPDYLIRFDDDDIISSTVLQKHEESNADCIADQFHTFYDVCTRKFSQKKTAWLPNTVIHKYDCAMEMVLAGQRHRPLILHDHSEQWSSYYSNRNLEFTTKEHPVYVRILAPGSITSRAASSGAEEERNKYLRYLLSFGSWRIKQHQLPDFAGSISFLNTVLKDTSELNLLQLELPLFWVWKNQLSRFKRKYFI